MASKSKHHIEVSSVALVDLKAEISRRQVEVKQRVEKLSDGCNVIRNHSTESTLTKPSIWRNSKKIIEEARKTLDSEPAPTDAQEYAEWEKSKRSLEAKAKLYEALKAAAMSGKNSDTLKRLSKDENIDILVDFEQKANKEFDKDSPNSPVNFHSINSSDDESGDSPNYEPACSDDEWEEYTDARGVKRVCMRKELSNRQSQDLESSYEGPLTYAHLREGEIRDHGVGFYAFSKDSEQREVEMNRLKELHRATEEGRARAQAIRAKRDAKMGQRLARLRARKGLPDVATAAAQCLGEVVVPATPTPLGPDSQSDIRLGNDDLDVASMLRRLRDEAEQRAIKEKEKTLTDGHITPVTSNNEQLTKTNLADIFLSQTENRPLKSIGKQREWDRGKSMITAQRYIQEERDKRLSEFAPPSNY